MYAYGVCEVEARRSMGCPTLPFSVLFFGTDSLTEPGTRLIANKPR